MSGGELWRRHRKIINPTFSTVKLNAFLPIINEKARKVTKVLEKSYLEKEEFNIVRLLSATTLENLLKSSFGLEKDFINNPGDKIFWGLLNAPNREVGKFYRSRVFSRYRAENALFRDKFDLNPPVERLCIEVSKFRNQVIQMC